MEKLDEVCLCVGARDQRVGRGVSLVNAHPSWIQSVKFAFAFISSLFFTSPADSFSAALCRLTLSDCLWVVKARCHSRAPPSHACLQRCAEILSRQSRLLETETESLKPMQALNVLHAALYTQPGRSLLYKPCQSIDMRLSLLGCTTLPLSPTVTQSFIIACLVFFSSFSLVFFLPKCERFGGLSRP